MNSPIQLEKYNPRWPRLFEGERARLEEILRPWLAGPIEHIGSTAVEGMSAKPVIDIMAAVGSLGESQGAIEALRPLDYLYAPYRPAVMHWFCKPEVTFRTHHLHLVPHGSATWRAAVTFRDRLRRDARAADEYVALKQSLALSFAHDREAYTKGKDDFVSRLVREGG